MALSLHFPPCPWPASCPFASVNRMAAPQLETQISSPVKLRGRMLTLAHLKLIQSPTDKPLFVWLRRILKLSLTPRLKKSPLISQQVYLQIVSGPSQSPGSSLWARPDDFENCLPQEKPIAASKRAHSQLSTPPLAHITLVLPLCIPQLVKQAQGALEKTIFSHLWLILRWRLTLSTIEPWTALLI